VADDWRAVYGLGNSQIGTLIVFGMGYGRYDPQSGYSSQAAYGQMSLARLMAHQQAASFNAGPPPKKKPERPIEQLQAEVDEWLKDAGV